jgi:hypothetical protein
MSDWNQDEVSPDEALKKKVDGLSALLVMVMVVAVFTLIMLGISHRSADQRLDRVEQAIGSERR